MKIIIPGVPYAQKRHRTTRVGAHARAYDHPDNVKFRERAQFYIYTAVKAKTGNQGLLHPSGPVAIAVAAYFPCPKADCRKTKPRGLRWKPNGKDVDNCLKALMDAGTGILYRDDAQVVAASVRKFIAAQDEQPRTVLYVNEVKEGVFPPTDLGPNPPS